MRRTTYNAQEGDVIGSLASLCAILEEVHDSQSFSQRGLARQERDVLEAVVNGKELLDKLYVKLISIEGACWKRELVNSEAKTFWGMRSMRKMARDKVSDWFSP